MRSTFIACELLLASAALALPEIPIAKRNKHGARPVKEKRSGLKKRQDGTLTMTVFDILTYSTGGAYYANSMYWREQ